MQLCMHARQAYKCSTTEVHAIERKKKTTGASKTPQTLSKSDGTTNGEGTQQWAGRCFENGLRRGFDVDGVDDITVFATLFPFNSIESIFVAVFPLYLLTLFFCSVSIFSILPFHSVHMCVIRICQYNHTSCCQLVLVYFSFFTLLALASFIQWNRVKTFTLWELLLVGARKRKCTHTTIHRNRSSTNPTGKECVTQ